MRRPLVVSLVLHAGALVALGVFHGRAEREPARVAALCCMNIEERDPSPEIPELPDPPELEPVEVASEPDPFPAEAKEPEPFEASELGVEDPPPEPPPVPRRVRIPPLSRPARKASVPAPPAVAAASRVISAVPRGDRCRPPEYPAAAQRAKVEGRVMLRVVVGTDGSVRSAEVEESSGSDLLDAAAIEAVREWTFEPAREGGRPVESVVRVPFRFRLRP